MSDPSPNTAADVIVLLGTSWARLENQNTRWRAVLHAWEADERIGCIRVVDYPSMTLGNLRRRRAEPAHSWDPRIGAVTGRVALAGRPTPLDRFAWRATGAALDDALSPTGGHRVVLAATPLWAPVLAHLRAERRGFDAVDDWRALPAVARLTGHVEAGYRAAAAADSASAVSPTLRDRLHEDFGIDATAIANGVDIDAFVGPRPPARAGLPDGPFALYVGVVQERVDVELLRAASTVMPVVVAGPVHDSMQAALADSRLTLLGAVPSDDVPGLLRSATIGLIPHRINALTASMDPMKLREYLAAGLPVVTTIEPPPALTSARVLVANADGFAGAVDAARDFPRLDGPDPNVAHRTWKSVADELFDLHLS
jgi:glycosyltransferase involved in cell wall biosynthesis